MWRSAVVVTIGVLLAGGMAASGQSPSPSIPGAGPGAWTAVELPAAPVGHEVFAIGVATGASMVVAVGQRVCDPAGGDAYRCWGQTWTSPDGASWTAQDARATGLDLGFIRPTTSGPEIGIQGVTYGPAGFIAFGRVQPERHGTQRAAVWRSADGIAWTGPLTTPFPTSTRLQAMLGAPDGYLLAGVLYARRAPRVAIWSSPDGERWTLAREQRQAFDIGAYVDTMEDPGSGGLGSLVTYPAPPDGGAIADGVLGVGTRCAPSYDADLWADGGCVLQDWRTVDGTIWRQGDGLPNGAWGSLVSAMDDRAVVGMPACIECPSVMLLSDDAETWRMGYGNPVDGTLAALTAHDGRFRAFLRTTTPDDPAGQLAVWSSVDGEAWRLDPVQPVSPVQGTISHPGVAVTQVDGRLLVLVPYDLQTDGRPFATVAYLEPLEAEP